MAVEDAFTLELPGDATTPREARKAVAERFGDQARCGELLLCVSEVVTNAVLHARSATIVTVRRTADLLTVEVRDDDPTPPVRRPHSPTATTGRGLRILDDLAVRWGSRPTGNGKVVWFDFDLAAAS
jgi:two-component sensor histidine kinase